jgi:hypothetical protein
MARISYPALMRWVGSGAGGMSPLPYGATARILVLAAGALCLPMKQENGRHRCQGSADLQAQDGHGLPW